MLKKTLLPCLLLVLSFLKVQGQIVVVSEYLNEVYPTEEWVELLITSDNIDLRGYKLRDNNSNQNSWQTEVVFAQHSLWQNLRAGTIIMLYHRNANSASVTYPIDTAKTDGFIQLSVQNTSYFTGGSFGTNPFYGGITLNIAGDGDIIEILDNNTVHVHALAHNNSPGIDFTSLASPKLNHSQDISSGEAVYVNAGADLTAYNGASGTTLTAKGSSNTFGLPNSTSNSLFWRSLRQPAYPSPALTGFANIAFSQVVLNWNACTDLNATDLTTGYLVLRNTSNSFSAPADGQTYSIGNTIGSAQVIAQLNNSALTTYTDVVSIACGNTYYYKVVAFRYGTDNINGNTYHPARGRAYNETGTNVISITRPNTIAAGIRAY